jgi:hypothetical protein
MKKWGMGAFGLAAVAGIVVLGAGVFGGVAQAQEPPDDQSSWHELYQQALADKLGVSVETLEAAQTEARDQVINDAEASGRITADQAERLRNAEPGDLRRGFGMKVRHAIGNVIDTAAGILGLSTDDVRAGLADGKSLNDLAAEQGVSNFEAQLVAGLTADLQAKLADGSITQEQYDKVIENLADRVANAVDHQGGQFREHLRDRFGGEGFGPGAPTDQAPTQQN